MGLAYLGSTSPLVEASVFARPIQNRKPEADT
jgi:hypothetical protein